MFFVLSKILHQLSIIILFVLICFINRGHDLQQIGLASATLTGCLCGPTWPEWRPIFFHKKVPTRLKMIQDDLPSRHPWSSPAVSSQPFSLAQWLFFFTKPSGPADVQRRRWSRAEVFSAVYWFGSVFWAPRGR